MKSFNEHLFESKKTYEFKIRVAGELPENFENKLEQALQKYEVTKVTSGTKTPIKTVPYHFPRLQNVEVYTFDVTVSYPVTCPILHNYIIDCCDIPKTHLVITSADEPFEELAQDVEANKTVKKEYVSLLTQPELDDSSVPKDAQQQVGTNRVMELLKELEQARKERNHEPAGNAPVGNSKDISLNVNTKSVIGS